MKTKHRFRLPAWLYVVLVLILDEIIFQLWTGAALTVERLVTMVLFTASFGLFFALFCTIGRSNLASRIVAFSFTVLFAVIYFGEYLMHDAYGSEGGYMSLGIILSTAGAAGNDFKDTIFGAIWGELWRFLVLLIPGVLYGVFGAIYRWGRVRGGWLTRGLIAACCAACFLLGYLSALTFPDAELYEKKFDFVKSVNTFGLLTAFRLDIRNGDRSLDFNLENGEQTPTLDPTEPIEPSDKQTPSEDETAEPAAPAKPYNMLDIDFAALAERESNAEIAKLHSYVASRSPSKTNAYTGLFEGKNLIFISAEAFALEVIDPELTPALYRLATQGIEFTDYYQPAWGGSTSTGEFSNLIGLVPTNANAMQDTVGKNMSFTIGNQLQALGYTSYGFHNNSYDYYHRDQTHPNFGYSEWIGMGNGMENGVAQTWPESDLEMIDYTMDLYMDQQPFSIYYMSVSGHGLYSLTGNYISAKNYDAVKDLDCSEIIKYYLASNLELEYAMQSLLDRLETEGILDDTVIVLTADHYPYCLEKSTTWGTERDYLSELYGYDVTDCFARDHNALIIWSGSIEGMELRVDTPTYSLDILPTLLNLFGIDYDSRLLVGRDVFSDAEPLVLWNGYSWKTDKGSYNAQTSTFTPAEGVTVEDGYVDRITGMVGNRINYSRGVLQWDYFDILFAEQ